MLLNLREDHDVDAPSERISDRGAAGRVLRRFFGETRASQLAPCFWFAVHWEVINNHVSSRLHAYRLPDHRECTGSARKGAYGSSILRNSVTSTFLCSGERKKLYLAEGGCKNPYRGTWPPSFWNTHGLSSSFIAMSNGIFVYKAIHCGPPAHLQSAFLILRPRAHRWGFSSQISNRNCEAPDCCTFGSHFYPVRRPLLYAPSSPFLRLRGVGLL